MLTIYRSNNIYFNTDIFLMRFLEKINHFYDLLFTILIRNDRKVGLYAIRPAQFFANFLYFYL